MTNSPDAGDVTEYSLSISRDLGNSTVPGVKQSTNLLTDLDNALTALASNPISKSNGATCSVKKVLNGLPAETQKKLNAIMEDDRIIASEICNLLKSFGFQVSAEVMRRHRRRAKGGGCSCPV